jgi:ketosteroid isomerase-like protein
MNESKNIQTIQDTYAAFGRLDIDALLGMMSNDIDWQFFGPSELITTGPRRGKPEVARFFQEVEATWSFEAFEPRQFIAQEDTVVVLGSYRGTAKETGRKFATEWAQVFTLRDGKVTQFREYADTANMADAARKSIGKV